jgi:hypothetical protein
MKTTSDYKQFLYLKVLRILIRLGWRMYFPARRYRDNRTDCVILYLANDVGGIDPFTKLCYIDYMGRISNNNCDGKLTNWLLEKAKKCGLFVNKCMPIIQGRDLIQCGLSPSDEFSKISDLWLAA